MEQTNNMLSRRAKATFYLLASPAMKINGWIYHHLRAPRNGILKVHLGPGQQKYIDGWINVDANLFTGKCDVWADLRNTLPFHNSTVDAMYSHHVIEHLPNLQFHFNEAYRCLKHGGVYRVGGPNGDAAISKFLENDSTWFFNFPENRDSIGGLLENFIFYGQEHLTILTFSLLEELMTKAGFINIKVCLPTKETYFPEFFQECLSKEYESSFDCPHTLIVEGTKPK